MAPDTCPRSASSGLGGPLGAQSARTGELPPEHSSTAGCARRGRPSRLAVSRVAVHPDSAGGARTLAVTRISRRHPRVDADYLEVLQGHSRPSADFSTPAARPPPHPTPGSTRRPPPPAAAPASTDPCRPTTASTTARVFARSGELDLGGSIHDALIAQAAWRTTCRWSRAMSGNTVWRWRGAPTAPTCLPDRRHHFARVPPRAPLRTGLHHDAASGSARRAERASAHPSSLRLVSQPAQASARRGRPARRPGRAWCGRARRSAWCRGRSPAGTRGHRGSRR